MDTFNLKLTMTWGLFFSIFLNDPLYTVNIISLFIVMLKYSSIPWELYVVAVALGGQWSDTSPVPGEMGTACL